MSKRKSTETDAETTEHGDAWEPPAPSVKSPPSGNEPERQFTSLARQGVIGHSSGVKLTIDRQQGVYRISFDKDKLEAVGKEFFDKQLKPLLVGHHQLQAGPEVRFYWQAAEKDWTMRFRFIERDAAGAEIVSNGKRQYVNMHNQVQVIANEVTNTIGQLMAEKLGMATSSEVAP